MEFKKLLLNWYDENKRDLPWRNTSDPYKIWLSEIILQQTRVEQGLPYYNKFIAKFPNISKLAHSNEQAVLKLWQGLGYYSRARNMHSAAQSVVQDHGGDFPNKYEDIRKLKGVGEYTASAISSFAFGLAYPVIDGNVLRVISRYFGIKEAIDTKLGLDLVKKSVTLVFDENNPALFNQAIMDLGSLICKPRNPDCTFCPLNSFCSAYKNGDQHEYPIKNNRVKVKEVQLSYFYIKWGNSTFVEKRITGFWKNLYQFPLIEGFTVFDELLETLDRLIETGQKRIITKTYSTTHILSHRKLFVDFYTINVDTRPKPLKSSIFEIEMEELSDRYPVPILIANFLKQIEDNG